MQFVRLADECPQMNFRSLQSIGGSPVTLVLYVNDVDEIANRAAAAGAKLA
jgi:PhnB protein